ncbi:fused DSP-PTPase phosphatase/NAD kinase-like protein [Agrobacterium genomosp. 13]|uniref:Tyrosine/serine protein phosphatase n=1 Tax=Agrobacterium genomosp. 13 str. CFBP 6927 TaxID=1183428 RepID=A0ABP2BKC5_9HYPH|nr:tyrosine-protein phosphatase [Agrobacterium genomosp. 13]CUX47188.1 Tyrosine/serine protein phosphatase [Agrobacterium genomosp. 13 str. CFBP 6927]
MFFSHRHAQLRGAAITFLGISEAARKLLCSLSASFLAIIIVLALNMGLQQLVGNFHEVLEGEFYRSAQPDAEDIADYRQRFGINTIINLRDEEKGEWFRIEEQAAREHGITFIHMPMSSARGPSLEEMSKLASLMTTARKPLLVHCEHGSNRTGLAAAIYLSRSDGIHPLLADLQLSPFFGHVPIPGIGRYEIFRSWREFRAIQFETSR